MVEGGGVSSEENILYRRLYVDVYIVVAMFRNDVFLRASDSMGLLLAALVRQTLF